MTEFFTDIFLLVIKLVLLFLLVIIFFNWKQRTDKEIKNLKCENAKLKCQNAATQVSLSELENRLKVVIKNKED